MKENEKNGNTVGNSSNKGKMAESDGWVYYAVNGNKIQEAFIVRKINFSLRNV